jgi:putative Mg2+ transporter-C (MgtC) family protein
VPLSPSLLDLTLRVVLTAIAAAAIGYERGERGKAAGLRTTLLVALAACFAIMLSNVLLPTAGRQPDSFVTFDVMRLPLGVLTGVGFIGAGAILKRDETVVGVTTAATLWYVTILGLLFGAGQLWLGAAASVLGVFVIEALRFVDPRIRRLRSGTLYVTARRGALTTEDVARLARAEGYDIAPSGAEIAVDSEELKFALHWRARDGEESVPAFVAALGGRQGVVAVRWDIAEREP